MRPPPPSAGSRALRGPALPAAGSPGAAARGAEWDNTYSRMRSKSLSFRVHSVGAGVTVAPCRWEMGQGEWDPFLQKANAKPVWVSLPTVTVQVTSGATWADLLSDGLRQLLWTSPALRAPVSVFRYYSKC